MAEKKKQHVVDIPESTLKVHMIHFGEHKGFGIMLQNFGDVFQIIWHRPDIGWFQDHIQMTTERSTYRKNEILAVSRILKTGAMLQIDNLLKTAEKGKDGKKTVSPKKGSATPRARHQGRK